MQHNPVGDIQVEHTINKEFELIGIAKDVEEATSINENQSAASYQSAQTTAGKDKYQASRLVQVKRLFISAKRPMSMYLAIINHT